MIARLTSKKFLIALVAVVGALLQNDVHTAAAIAAAYFGVQGVIDHAKPAEPEAPVLEGDGTA